MALTFNEFTGSFSSLASQCLLLLVYPIQPRYRVRSRNVQSRCGGSAGHSALWGVNVDEGQYSGGLTGSIWNVHLQTTTEIRESKEAQKEQANDTLLANLVGMIVEYLFMHPEGDTKTGIRDELNFNTLKITAGLNEAVKKGIVEEVKVTKNNREYAGYRVTAHCDAHPDTPDNPDGHDCSAGS